MHKKNWRLPTLPQLTCSTIGVKGLNYRVRDGNGWDPFAMITRLTIMLHMLHQGRFPAKQHCRTIEGLYNNMVKPHE